MDRPAAVAAPGGEPPSLRDFHPIPGRDEQYSPPFMRANSVLKLRETSTKVVVGAAKPPGAELQSSLEAFHGKPVEILQITKAELATELARISLRENWGHGAQAECAGRQLLDRLANDAPVVELVNGLLNDAVRMHASDVHFEAGPRECRVRFRIDGALATMETFGRELFPALATRIKLMARLNIMERRLPQDGRVTVAVSGGSVDLRVSSVPSHDGESIVVRLFPERSEGMPLGALGFRPADLELLKEVSRRPAGLVLVTGPTGSGKSTTLGAILRYLESDERKLLSIEDPIEQLIEGIVQIQTNDQIGLSFERVLRHVLRQDPNVVMVGEIRDPATCTLAVRAGLTGRLVFSTLHTRNAVSAVARLRNLGAPAYLVAEILQGAVAQRLVRRLCPFCRVAASPHRQLRTLLRSHGLPFERVFAPVGCAHCRHTGYLGRVPLVEIFVPDAASRDAIASERSIASHVARGGLEKQRDLLADGLEKVAQGETDFDEIRSVLEVP